MKWRGGPLVITAALVCGWLLAAAPVQVALAAAEGAIFSSASSVSAALPDGIMTLAAGKLTLRSMPMDDLVPVNSAPSPKGTAAAPQRVQSRASGSAAPQQQPQAGQGEKKGAIKLFGSVEFRGTLKNMPKWQRVVEAEERKRTFDGDLSKVMRPALYKQWQELRGRMGKASTMEKVRAVNTFFNRWPYRTDREVWKVDDYWATPAEFLQRSGDCEDFAITKMYALIKLGVSPDSMRVVALKDTIRSLAHAILAVYIGDEAYVLDNLTDMVLPHSRYRNYNPQYSVNGVYRWAHVVPKNKQ